MTEQDILDIQDMIDADKEALTAKRRTLLKDVKDGTISSEEYKTRLEEIQAESARLSYEQHNLDNLWNGLLKEEKERNRQTRRREVSKKIKEEKLLSMHAEEEDETSELTGPEIPVEQIVSTHVEDRTNA
ncbi:MAG: hypothetical protein IJ817_02855 [Clostridia bacterium]|nr:hypothetical protein [Clostridia bacterium]